MVVRLAANKYVYLLPFIQKLWTSIENISWYLCLGFRRVVFEVKKSIFVTSYFNSLLLFFSLKCWHFQSFLDLTIKLIDLFEHWLNIIPWKNSPFSVSITAFLTDSIGPLFKKQRLPKRNIFCDALFLNATVEEP